MSVYLPVGLREILQEKENNVNFLFSPSYSLSFFSIEKQTKQNKKHQQVES